MSKQNETSSNDKQVTTTPRRRGRRLLIAGVAAAVIGVFSVAGISYANEGSDMGERHHMHGMHGPMTPEMTAKHIDRMIKHILPDGTPEQKAKVTAIAKAAIADLQPLREQRRAAHEQAVKLLTQPNIDRAALEQVRATEMQLAEQASKRITQAMADSAEVLTPEQRAKAAERFKKHMGHMG